METDFTKINHYVLLDGDDEAVPLVRFASLDECAEYTKQAELQDGGCFFWKYVPAQVNTEASAEEG